MIITDMPYICSGGNDGLFKIWQAESGTCEFTIQEVAPVNALTFFDDETGQNQYAMIAIGLQDGSILMRNLNDGCPILWQLDNRTYCHQSAVVSIAKFGGNFVSAGRDGYLIYWGTMLDPNFG